MLAQKQAMAEPNKISHIADRPRSIADFSLYRPVAGHPDWVRLMDEAKELAAEIRPGLEKPRSVLRDLSRRTRSLGRAGQNWILNRRIHRQGREDLLPSLFLWTALRTCNFTCTYCDDHMGNKYPELPNEGVLNTEQAIRLLEIMATRASALYFAGGEPTIRKDLPELTRAARDLNYYPIIVNSNGSLLHRQLKKEAWSSWLADMDNIIISLDSLDLKSLSKMWVYRKPEDVLRNLLMLRELSDEMRFKLMVNVVVQPDTVEQASHVVDLVNDLGIWLNVVPVNTGAFVDKTLADDPAYIALAEKILARKKAGYPVTGSLRMNRRLLYSEDLTCRNSLKPHVDYDGRLLWPCKATVNVKPKYINVLDFKDVDSLYHYATQQIDPAGFKGTGENQCGGNCNWAQNYATDSYAHGLGHPTAFIREVIEFALQR
jgi:MoaA/NifB/PqqE/SkfB family radical SAM enzyme